MLDPMKMLPDDRPPENLLDDIIPSAMEPSDTNLIQSQQLQVDYFISTAMKSQGSLFLEFNSKMKLEDELN